jgi:ATP-dependent Clp protease ATP-binding subunit ClpA
VFNFLKDTDAKTKIVDQQVEVLNRSLRERQRVDVYCTRAFKRLLMVHPNGFERNGARGVRNLLNRFVLNALAVRLFADADACQGKTFKVDYQVAQDEIGTRPFDKGALHYEWIVK